LSGDTVVTPCDGGSWCYGDGPSALAYCKGGKRLFIVNGTETTQTSAVLTTGILGSSQSTGTSLSSMKNGGGSKLSATAIIWIGVGIPLCLAVVGLILTICWKQRRKETTVNDTAGAEIQQNRFSNVSYVQPVLPGNQSTPRNVLWSQQPAANPYHQPQQPSNAHSPPVIYNSNYTEMPGLTYAP
jgi:hypothetical protein